MIHSRVILLLITPFVFLQLLSAQEIKIEQIIDTNLFLTEDSTLVSMANLNVPSLNDPDSVRQQLAQKIIDYAELYLQGYSCIFTPAANKNCMAQQESKSGHIFRKYPLSNLNMNAQYLEKGYAVYLPCDTLYMAEYAAASQKAMEHKKGLWRSMKSSLRRADFFNRMRLTNWLLQLEYDVKEYIPIIGINYRWSDLYSFYNNQQFAFNLSSEVGTLIYFMLPYANLGSEARFKKFYIRGHYDVLLPVFWLVDSNEIKALNFWGMDVGLQIPLSNNAGIELELNIKGSHKYSVNLLSISFVAF